MLRLVEPELRSEGKVLFRTSSSDSICIGPGFIEFFKSGEVSRINSSEIGTITHFWGSLVIRFRDADVSGRKDKIFRFPENIPNRKLFLILLETLCGLKIE